MKKSQICSIIVSFIQSFLDDQEKLHSYTDKKSFVRNRLLSLTGVSILGIIYAPDIQVSSNIWGILAVVPKLQFSFGALHSNFLF